MCGASSLSVVFSSWPGTSQMLWMPQYLVGVRSLDCVQIGGPVHNINQLTNQLVNSVSVAGFVLCRNLMYQTVWQYTLRLSLAVCQTRICVCVCASVLASVRSLSESLSVCSSVRPSVCLPACHLTANLYYIVCVDFKYIFADQMVYRHFEIWIYIFFCHSYKYQMDDAK